MFHKVQRIGRVLASGRYMTRTRPSGRISNHFTVQLTLLTTLAFPAGFGLGPQLLLIHNVLIAFSRSAANVAQCNGFVAINLPIRAIMNQRISVCISLLVYSLTNSLPTVVAIAR